MPEFQPYPAIRYHYSGQETIVHNAEEDEALGGGWAERPHDWLRYKGARRLDPRHDPIKWVDQWPLESLRESLKNQIKARLLKIHARFWQNPDQPGADTEAMVVALDQIAQVLFDAQFLREHHLTHEIPELIWDSAIAGGWWSLASETPSRMFREKLGRYWVFRDDTRNWDMLFGTAVAKWRAILLESRAPGSEPPAPKRQDLTIARTTPRAQRWEDIHILFLSDERIEISIQDCRETWNYGEMGCADRRNGTPNQCWALLKILAQNQGFLPLNRGSSEWAAIEKQVERTRKFLREHFGLTEDPLPLKKGSGYRLRCHIGLAPSYRT